MTKRWGPNLRSDVTASKRSAAKRARRTAAAEAATTAEIDVLDVNDDIEAGLAALNEPVVATWESVKERLMRR